MSNEDFARNPNTPPEALAMLSTSPSAAVRLLVAQNPNTPKVALRFLAQDEDRAVREAVAQNPMTPYDAFAAKEAAPSPVAPATVTPAPVTPAPVTPIAPPQTQPIHPTPAPAAPPPPPPGAVAAPVDINLTHEDFEEEDSAAPVYPSSPAAPEPAVTPSAHSAHGHSHQPVLPSNLSLWQRFLVFLGLYRG